MKLGGRGRGRGRGRGFGHGPKQGSARSGGIASFSGNKITFD